MTGGRRLGFGRAVGTLATGAAAAQAVVLLARPVLTRLYTPEAFGALAVFVAPAYLLASLATLRYEDAVALPATRRDAAGVTALAALAAVFVGLGVLALAPWRAALAEALGVPALAPLLPLASAVAVALGVASAAQGWLAREGRFRQIALASLVQSVGVVGVQLAVPGAGAAGLVAGVVLGAVLFAAVLAAGAVGRGGAPSGVVAEARGADLGALARRFRRFPLFGVPASLLNQAGARLPPLALAAAFGPAAVGQFALALAAVAVPVGIVADAVGQVFYVRAGEAHRAGRLGPLVEAVHARLSAVAAVPVVAVAVLGPDLFAAVFGEPWRAAGDAARVLAPWLWLSSVAPPLTRAFDVTERQGAELASGLATAGLIGAGLAVGTASGDLGTALAALSVAGTLARALQIGWTFRVSGARVGVGVRDAAGGALRATLWLVPAAAAQATVGLWPAVALAALGGAACVVPLVRQRAVGEPPATRG